MTKRLHCNLTKKAVVVSHDESVIPCCRFKVERDQRALSLSELKDGNILESPFYREIREEFMRGRFPRGCKTCEAEEKNGLVSMRQRRGEEEYPAITLEDLELFVGNLCNMKCIMCGPEFSSLWQKELNTDLKIKQGIAINDLKGLDISHLRSLRLLGGETLINKSFYDIIQWVREKADPRKIELSFSTNGSVGPNPDLLYSFQDFNRVGFDFSIDGLSELAEKIRPGVSWSIIENNIRDWIRVKEANSFLKFNVHTTIQKDNVNHLDEIIMFCIELGLPWTFKVLEHPDEFSIKCLDEDELKKAQEKLKDHPSTHLFQSYFKGRGKLDQWKFLTNKLSY
jgi:sulfatase maturation enzyme AslB (radical SAM superfamily)